MYLFVWEAGFGLGWGHAGRRFWHVGWSGCG